MPKPRKKKPTVTESLAGEALSAAEKAKKSSKRVASEAAKVLDAAKKRKKRP